MPNELKQHQREHEHHDTGQGRPCALSLRLSGSPGQGRQGAFSAQVDKLDVTFDADGTTSVTMKLPSGGSVSVNPNGGHARVVPCACGCSRGAPMEDAG